MSYRISSPLSQTTEIVPATLQESDFIRSKTISRFEDGTTYQNAKLTIPVVVKRGTESHLYPVNAYVRVYEVTKSVHLISKQSLP
jgi:hypothetical protein